MRSSATRTVAGRVNGDGTIAHAGGGGFIVSRTTAGSYSLTTPGQRLLSVNITIGGGAFCFATADSFSGSNCRVLITNSGVTAQVDQPWSFTAVVAA